MKRLLFFLLIFSFSFGQNYRNAFQAAYQAFPDIPRGILEAHAWTQTRIRHIDPRTEQPSCTGMPLPYGPMGLFDNGKGVFRENLLTVAKFSKIPKDLIKNNPQQNIFAYAKAFQVIANSLKIKSQNPADYVPVLVVLSELPETDTLALNLYLYEVFSFLNKREQQQKYSFPSYNLNLKKIFKNYYSLVTAPTLQVQKTMSPDYPPAIWDPTTCNFSSRNGTAISAVTVHTIQGTYAGCIAWFKNCSANVSAHYVLRSSDGQVTQMVLEADKAWHVGIHNPYTIGLEHEGYINDPSWYTDAMYQSSADLVRDICNSGYGINPLRTYFGPGCSGSSSSCQLGNCIRIKGHHHYSSQTHTDPGPNWNWSKYYKLINDNLPTTTYTATTGTLYDSGGPTGNYADDERQAWLITKPGATSITLNFVSFNTELNYDYLFIYDGGSVWSPLVGQYHGTTSPGTITINNDSVLIEFRSDCATNAPGWEIAWTITDGDTIPPTTTPEPPVAWQNKDFTLTFNDADNSALKYRFYLVADSLNSNWSANTNNGFLFDDFNNITAWTNQAGTWNASASLLQQTDEAVGNSNLYQPLNQTSANVYLYHWKQKINTGTSTNKRAGLHIFCDNATLSNRGNSYFVYLREDNNKIQWYKVTNDVFNLELDIPFTINPNQWYDCKLLYDPSTGVANFRLDDSLIFSWTEPSPLTAGNAVSFRTGNAITDFDSLRVYKSRTGNSVTVSVAGASPDVRYDAYNVGKKSAKVFSLVIDVANLVSQPAWKYLKVDTTPPSSDFSNVLSVYTTNTTYTFQDIDNVGIQKAYYQLLYLDAGEERGNASNGYFYEDFTDNVLWTNQVGTWNLTAGTITQSDEANSNTNYYASVAQVGTRKYLYHFKMKIGGTGTNRRAGIHFFCDDATLPNRGNSYFIYLRADNNKVQIYDVVADTWTLRADSVFTINPNQWYDVKTFYEPATGKIEVYVDDQFAAEWTDPAPLTAGSFISLRTGNANVEYDEIRVLSARTPNQINKTMSATINITVGPGQDFATNNPTPTTPAGRIVAFLQDSAGNWSLNIKPVNVDFTPTAFVNIALSGTRSENNVFLKWKTTLDSNLISAVKIWRSSDGISFKNIAKIKEWTNHYTDTYSGKNVYYKVSLLDNAGAEHFSNVITLGNLLTSEEILYPNPVSGNGTLVFRSEKNYQNLLSVNIYDLTGRALPEAILSRTRSENILSIKLNNLPRGMYLLKISYEKGSLLRKFIVE